MSLQYFLGGSFYVAFLWLRFWLNVAHARFFVNVFPNTALNSVYQGIADKMKSVGLVQIFCPVKETNRTHSQSYVEDLSTQTGRKRCAKTAVLNLSVLPYIFVKRSLSVENERKTRALWTCRTSCGSASAAEHGLCSDEFAAVRCASARKGTRITRSGDRQSVVEHFSHTVPYTKGTVARS